MCEKCNEIDIEIARCLRLKSQVDDRQLHEAADRIIAKLEAEKIALHPKHRIKIRHRSPSPTPWKWEIHLGNRLITASNDFFASQAAAHEAARIALKRLLSAERE